MSKNINDTLIGWMNGQKLFNDVKNDITNFFGKDVGKRNLAARNIAISVWGRYRMLGPTPIFWELENSETMRLFYDNYRDHTAHQVKVLILGLYIYDNVDRVQKTVNRYISKNYPGSTSPVHESEIFNKIWIATSLFHDIGYVIECKEFDEITGNEYVAQIIHEINTRCEYPLTNTHGYNVTKQTECNCFKIYKAEIQAITEIEKKSYFNDLYDAAKRAHLVNTRAVNPMEVYYNMAQKFLISDRSYRDHGIASALLLLHIWNAFIEKVSDYLEQGVREDTVGYEYIVSMINEDLANLEEYKFVIKTAASSIALHNIKKSDEISKSPNINLDGFNISLDEDKGLPIAFLLRMVDELQDWDRNYSRPISTKDSLLDADDMFIGINNDKVEISYTLDDDSLKHPWKGTIMGRYLKYREKLDKYLNPYDLDSILCYKGQNEEKPENVFAEEWGLNQIYRKRSETNNLFIEKNFNYKECDIIAFGLSNLRDHFSKVIEKNLKKGMKMRIITLQPDSLYAKQREIEENKKGNIRGSIIDLLRWVRDLKKTCGNIELKLYNALTLDFYCRLDDKIYVGPYEPGKVSRDIITYEFKKGIGYEYYFENFNRIWEGSAPGIEVTDIAYKYYVQDQEEIVNKILYIYCKRMPGYDEKLKNVGAVVVKLDKCNEKRKTIFFWNKENGSTRYSEHKIKMGAVGFYDDYKRSYLCHFVSEDKGIYYAPNYNKSTLIDITYRKKTAGSKKELTDILVSPIWNADKDQIVGILTFEFRSPPLDFKQLDLDIAELNKCKKNRTAKSIKQFLSLCEVADECSELLSMIIVDYHICDPTKVFERDIIKELKEGI